MKIQQSRMANIELLRTISMFMVVAIHLFTKTSVLWEMNPARPVYYISWILYGLCMTGVNCYIIISGYFLADSKFKLKKLLDIYVQTFFYSVVISLVVKYVLGVELKDGWRQIVFPITNRQYWFITNYLALYCLVPFLGVFINALDKRKYRQLLLVMGILFSVIPTFLHAENWLEEGGAYGIVWFIFLYLLGAYLKRYQEEIKYAWLWYGVMIFTIPACKFAVMAIGSLQSVISADKVLKISEIFYSFNSPFALIASLLIFLCFLKVKLSKTVAKLIIPISGLTLGVYLIHNNRSIAHFLWEKAQINFWLVEKENIGAILLILVAVFGGCAILEKVRKILFRIIGIDTLIEKAAIKTEQLVTHKNEKGKK